MDQSIPSATSANGSWSADDGFVSFSFDTANLDLDPSSFGFYWTMYCGNDVIERLDPVTAPEADTADVFLLGLGMIGLVVMRRKTVGKMVS